MQLSKQSLVRWRRFHGYNCPDGNAHIKNGRSLKKYSKFTPTIHINPNSYSFRILFIMIIVRFFIICFINGWKYQKVATNWITNWCVYLRCIYETSQKMTLKFILCCMKHVFQKFQQLIYHFLIFSELYYNKYLRVCETLWGAREMASVALSAERERRIENVFHMLLNYRFLKRCFFMDAYPMHM